MESWLMKSGKDFISFEMSQYSNSSSSKTTGLISSIKMLIENCKNV